MTALGRKLTTHEAKAALGAMALIAAVGTRIPKAPVGGARPWYTEKPLHVQREELWEKRLLVEDEEWVVLEHG